MMTTIEMTRKLHELKELEALIAEAEKDAESIKDEIKAEMTEQGVEEMNVDIFKIRYKTVTSSRFDSKSFKAKYADLFNQYTKQTESRRFTIS